MWVNYLDNIPAILVLEYMEDMEYQPCLKEKIDYVGKK